MTERQRLARDLRQTIWVNGRRASDPQRKAEAELAFKVAQFLDDEQAAIDRLFGPPEVSELL